MKRLIFILFMILSIYATNNNTKNNREQIRAVYLATNYGLDWPKNIIETNNQMENLDSIFKLIKNNGFNTVFFQTRTNAKVLYNSKYEKKESFLSDNFDALKYATVLAKKYNIKIFAWLNMLKISNDKFNSESTYDHFVNLYPNLYFDSFETTGKISCWLNPDKVDVHDYLLNIISEVISYNIDGVVLDYFRYPDSKIYEDYLSDNIIEKGYHRKKNLTMLLSKIYKLIKNKNPQIKLAVCPIGIYKNTKQIRGLQAFSDVHQDLIEWQKYLDYIAPQVYWEMNHPTAPFKEVVQNWMQLIDNNKIIISIAAYKPKVKDEIENQIQFVLNKDLNLSIFRFTFCKDVIIK